MGCFVLYGGAHLALVALVAGAFGEYEYLTVIEHFEDLAHRGERGTFAVYKNDSEPREQELGRLALGKIHLAYISSVPRDVHLRERYIHRRQMIAGVYALPLFYDVLPAYHFRRIYRTPQAVETSAEIIKRFSHILPIALSRYADIRQNVPLMYSLPQNEHISQH